MIYKAFLRLLFIGFLSMVIFACGDSEQRDLEKPDNTEIDSIKLSEELGLEDGEAKIFTMPTPLQVASALEIMGVAYNGELLLQHKIVTSKSDPDLSLAMGMYMVDLGYTIAYNHPQKGLDYAQDIQKIMEQLPISYYVNDGFRKQFKNNINNRDSLSKIVLKGYNDANQYITETENEGIGLLILTGAYIEGFYLAANSRVENIWKDEYESMIIQQKQFMDNFLILLQPYTVDGDIDKVVSLLKDLNTAFDGMDINYNDKTQTYELNQHISSAKREQMKAKVNEIRKSILEKIIS